MILLIADGYVWRMCVAYILLIYIYWIDDDNIHSPNDLLRGRYGSVLHVWDGCSFRLGAVAQAIHR